MLKRITVFLTALLLLLTAALPACAAAASAPAAQAEAQLRAILEGQLSRSGADGLQQWIDSAVADTVGAGGEWYVLGLSQLSFGELTGDLSAPLAALESSLAASGSYAAATRQKLALCTLAAGGDPALAQPAAGSIGQQGMMSWIFGLHLLNNGVAAPEHTPESAAKQLLSLRLEDGGWALMGKTSDVDVTAMALQALAPHREDPAVAEAVEQALALLSARQQEDGGFIGMGVPNPESAAQVLTALCALGIDPLQDERFLKNGCTIPDSFAAYALPEGGYSHTAGGAYNATATVQVFLACTAWQRMLAGQPGLYMLDGRGEGAAPDTQPAGALSVGIIGGADGPTAVLVSAPGGWRLFAAAGIAVLALLWCIVLLLRGKRKPGHFLLTLAIAAAMVVLVLVTDVQRPESYYRQDAPKGSPIGNVTLEIRCDTLPAGTENVPADGAVLQKAQYPIWAGDTVYDLLTRAARQHRLLLDARGGEGMKYLAGIQYLYEQAHGELSGWMYFVNGQSASQSCDRLLLNDGDSILWAYTCEMGADLP